MTPQDVRPSLSEFAEKEAAVGKFTDYSTVGIRVGELMTLFRALRAIASNAEAWHADEDGKARALAVIARWARQPSTVPPGVGIENACKCDDKRLPWCDDCVAVMNQGDDD